MERTAWKPKGTFQYNWFANLTADLWTRHILPVLANKKRPLTYIEVGVAEGQSLIFALDHFGNDSHLIGVDPFWPSRGWRPEEGNQTMEKCLANISGWFGEAPNSIHVDCDYEWDLKDRPFCQIYRESSQDFLRDKPLAEFDLAYCDGCHDAPQAMFDMMMLFRGLGEGGILVVDDYERGYRGGRPQVRPACDAFEKVHQGYFDHLYIHPKQVAYVKTRRRGRREYPPYLAQAGVLAPIGETGS